MINDSYKAVKTFDFIMILSGFWQTWFEEILENKKVSGMEKSYQLKTIKFLLNSVLK